MTQGDDLRGEAAQTHRAFALEAVDASWLVRNVRCADACPVSTRAGKYVSLLADGEYQEAYRWARRPNPFASVCGRICAHPCETACNRGRMDAPLAIRALKRFLTERFGVESPRALDLKDRLGLTRQPPREEKVAIIGAGPCGLSCAHDLAILGYRPVVLDAAPAAGGMLKLGVPEYRLSRQLLQREIDFVANLGATIKLNVKVGRDVTVEELRESYDALFISCGAQAARNIHFEGDDLDGVIKGIDFLRDVNLGQEVHLAKKVVVIGGGNVAFDVARTAVRQATSDLSDEKKGAHEVMDVARAARFLGAEVHVVCLEPRDAMLADDEEVEAAAAEGLFLHNSRGPKRIVGKGGKVTGLETLRVESIFDSAGRFNPTFRDGSEQILETEMIIMAIGQAVDASFIGADSGIEVTRRGTIKVDEESMATSASGVFAGGDAAFGARVAIHAIADGRLAASSIHAHLSGEPLAKPLVKYTGVHRRHYFLRGDYHRRDRAPLPMLPAERRIGIVEVELCLDDQAARYEAGRCLRCFYNVTINPDNCVLCGRCAEACPMKCIRMVSMDRVAVGTEEQAYLERARPDLGDPEDDLHHYVMAQDEEACIRCGQCVMACPADACTMMRIELEEGGVAGPQIAVPIATAKGEV